MNKFSNYNIDIDENEIIRLIGYNDSSISDEILHEVKDGILDSKQYLQPVSIWDEYKIIKFNDDLKQVILENDITLEGEYIFKNLKKCSSVIITLSTAGIKIDEVIKKYFDEGDFLKGMIYDNIGSYVVGYAEKILWNKLVEKVDKDKMGITNRMSPGDFDWGIEAQKKIFTCLDAKSIGVTLNDSCLMTPIKSISTIFGVGKDIGIGTVGHTCKDCKLKHCFMRKDQKVKITVINNGQEKILEVKRDSNLLKVLRENGVFIEAPCGGKGVCGKCKVKCIKMPPKPSEYDLRHLSDEEIKEGYRLSCGITTLHPMTVEILDNTKSMKVLQDSELENFVINPRVKKIYLELQKPSIQDQTDDCNRVISSIDGVDSIDFNIIHKINRVLREADFKCTATIMNNKIIDVEAGNTIKYNYGLAVDIGTTTVVSYLIDLNSGKIIDVVSGINEQKSYGADVASRIQYTTENEDGLTVLNDAIINQLNSMLEKLCNKNKIKLDNIYDAVIVGNTTMTHLLMNVPPECIGKAPYIPVINQAVTTKAKDLGLDMCGYVTVLDGLSSYVGSDITAGILSSGMSNSKEYSLLLDLGTNGEMAIGNKDKIITCSTAAGPAFEGASIKYGVGGIIGAISQIDLSQEKIYNTIEDKKPCGICGSGVLDAVAQLVEHKIVDETGRFYDTEELEDNKLKDNVIDDDNGNKQFLIYEDKQDNSSNIYFTQKDIREVQLAKAAIFAGIKILINESGVKVEDIENIYIAGGFGNYMNVRSAIDIGIIPKELENKVKSIGNSAGKGAKMTVLSNESIEQIKEIVAKSKYVELSTRLDFQNYFIDGMTFGG